VRRPPLHLPLHRTPAARPANPAADVRPPAATSSAIVQSIFAFCFFHGDVPAMSLLDAPALYAPGSLERG